MNELIVDGTGYQAGDLALAVLITLSALLSYIRIGFETGALRLLVPRMALGIGFTVWAMRFWYTIWIGGDVMVAPVSMVAIALICTGYSVVQVVAIRRAFALSQHPIFCLQEPDERCHREDRVREALLKRWSE